MVRTCLLGFAGLASLAAPALAHHSYSQYDRQTERSLTGTVESIEWTNPHILISLRAADRGAGTAVWRLEGHAPLMLSRNGFDRNAVKPGDRLQVTFHPLREGNGGTLIKFTLADSRTFNRFGVLQKASH